MDKLRGDERRRELPFEPDERFPSGPWKGFFLQPPLRGRHWMDLRLYMTDGNGGSLTVLRYTGPMLPHGPAPGAR